MFTYPECISLFKVWLQINARFLSGNLITSRQPPTAFSTVAESSSVMPRSYVKKKLKIFHFFNAILLTFTASKVKTEFSKVVGQLLLLFCNPGVSPQRAS